jgi:hypothetical protein
VYVTVVELSRIVHEGRQYPKNGGFRLSRERLIKLTQIVLLLVNQIIKSVFRVNTYIRILNPKRDESVGRITHSI